MDLNVKTSNGSYSVIIRKGVLKEAYKYINLKRKILIVTDDNIPSIYIDTISKQCENYLVYTITHGETSKNFDNYKNILTFMVENNFTRNDAIIAIGGGVVGDLAGFVASTYMRGIDFYNIPTSLLAQVDSSIGGKTAIDLNNIKNIVGAFYPPKCVLIDIDTLKTLDKRQLHAGLVEAIKMAITCDKDLFDFIYSSKDLYADIETIIYKSLLIKKYVVENDELENDLRKVLNFGHTIGHAIESYSNMNLLHGECVGLGMIHFVSENIKNKIIELLRKYDLPISYDYTLSDLLPYLTKDKKAKGDILQVVYVNEIGKFEFKKINIEEIKNFF